jgi:hypothetical protein
VWKYTNCQTRWYRYTSWCILYQLQTLQSSIRKKNVDSSFSQGLFPWKKFWKNGVKIFSLLQKVLLHHMHTIPSHNFPPMPSLKNSPVDNAYSFLISHTMFKLLNTFTVVPPSKRGTVFFIIIMYYIPKRLISHICTMCPIHYTTHASTHTTVVPWFNAALNQSVMIGWLEKKHRCLK